MATGDIKNNLRKLKKELHVIKYRSDVDFEGMAKGVVSAFLPILHYIVTDYCCELAIYLTENNYDFFGKSDLRFIDVLYKILIQEFSMKPMLTKQQFFTRGFAEKKIMFLTKIIDLFHQKATSLIPKQTKKVKVCSSKLQVNQDSEKKSKESTTMPQINNISENVIAEKAKKKKAKEENLNFFMTDRERKFVKSDLSCKNDCFLYPSSTASVEKKSVSFCEPPVEFSDEEKQTFLPQKSLHHYKSHQNSYQTSNINRKTEDLNLKAPQNNSSKSYIYFVDETEPTETQVFEIDSCDITGNIVLPKVVKETEKNSRCLVCEQIEKEPISVMSKINKLENQLEKVLDINRELEGKLVILESRISLLENRKELEIPDEKLQQSFLNDVTSDILNLSNVTKSENTTKSEDYMTYKSIIPPLHGQLSCENLSYSLNSKFNSSKSKENLDRAPSPYLSREHSTNRFNVDSFDFMCQSTKSTIAHLQQQINETKLMFQKEEI